jgi:hypothetical protein
MEEKLDLKEAKKKQRPKLSGKTSTLKIDLDTETLLRLRQLKAKMYCKNWQEFIQKILEKEKYLVSDDVIAF